MLLHVFHQHFDEGVGQEDGRKRRTKMSKQTTKFKKKKEGGTETTIHHVQSYIANIFQLKKMKRRSKKV
jgi:hypothetical protein